MQFKFKKESSKEERIEKCKRLLLQNPDKVPIILEKDPSSKFEGNYIKRLIKKDFTVSKFHLLIKKLFKLPEEQALFFAAKGKYNIIGEKTMGEIYTTYKDKEDGFLYIMYSSELVYG